MPIPQARIQECPVEYLRDSVEIVEGIDLAAIRQTIIDAPNQEFTSLGKVGCESLGGDLSVGVKKRKMRIDTDRPVHEIAIAEALIRADRTLRNNLPLFTVGLTLDSRLIGILTEDFSEGGVHVVDEDKHRIPFMPKASDMPTPLHRQVYEALGGNVYAEALGHMSSIVCGKAVLIDFNEIAYVDSGNVRAVTEQVEAFRDLAYLPLD